MIPFESVPGMPPIFLAFVRGSAPEFFPDEPVGTAVEARARAVARAGEPARIATGQQAGFLGGPLYTLTKALAADVAARRLSDSGIPAKGLFWMATEDHDLGEIAQTTLPSDDGPRHFQLEEPGIRRFQPTGEVRIPDSAGEVLGLLGADGDTVAGRLAHFWKPGRTFGEAFHDTLARLLGDRAVAPFDPLRDGDRAGEMEFFSACLERGTEIVEALGRVEARLRASGYEPQVSRPENDFPYFVIIDGFRRKVSFRAGRFSVHGHDRTFSSEELRTWLEGQRGRPSPAALLRPVLAATLFPIAAAVLGPSELAYHAQTLPLFELLGVPAPVFLPRPHLLPRGARERRAAEALGLRDEDLFRARDALAGRPPEVAGTLSEIERDARRRLGSSRAEIERIDPTLVSPLESAIEKVGHSIARLRAKVERAADRLDADKNRRIAIVENALAPEGRPADRVYPAAAYIARFGDAFTARIAEEAECRTDGARFVDFE